MTIHVAVLGLLLLMPWNQLRPTADRPGRSVQLASFHSESLTGKLEQADPSRSKSDATPVSPIENAEINPSAQAETASAVRAGDFVDSTAIVTGDAASGNSFPPNDDAGVGNQDFGQLVEQLKRDGLDIVITFDSTGSMDAEIRQLKMRIERIGGALLKLVPKTRIGICTYRDEGDKYVVQGLKLTDKLPRVTEYLGDISAAGGADTPEAVDQGLRWAIKQNAFRPNARKVILLFGDAPPHSSKKESCLKLATEFRHQQNGVVSTVTCHSDDRLPDFVEIAQVGGGESFVSLDEREIMSQLMVLAFGSQHRDKVIEALELLEH